MKTRNKFKLNNKDQKPIPLKDLLNNETLPLDPVLRKKELNKRYRVIYFRNRRARITEEKKLKIKVYKRRLMKQTLNLTTENKYTKGWTLVKYKYGPEKSLTFDEWVDYGFSKVYLSTPNARIIRKDPSINSRKLDNILLAVKVVIPPNTKRNPKYDPSRPVKYHKTNTWKVLIDPRPDIPYKGEFCKYWS